MIIILSILCVLLFIGLILQDTVIFTESKTGLIKEIRSQVYPDVGETNVFIKFEGDELYSVFLVGDHTGPFPPSILENKTCKVTWYTKTGEEVYRILLSIDLVEE